MVQQLADFEFDHEGEVTGSHRCLGQFLMESHD
jgi:hypothetical protein